MEAERFLKNWHYEKRTYIRMKNNNSNKIHNLTLASMFLALAFILPFLTGQIQQIGSMLCPMHIPVILCGFFCGGYWGLGVGFIAPLLRSITLGMPPLFPVAICMAFELATYGFVAGFLHKRSTKNIVSHDQIDVVSQKQASRQLSDYKRNVYITLIVAMVLGRIVWGLAMFACLGFEPSKFGLSAFITGAITTAVPGIVLQLILIPVIVISLRKYANPN